MPIGVRPIIRPLIVLVFVALLASPALAKSHGEILSSNSLYGEAATTPPDKIPTLCANIIARQNAGSVGKSDAAQLYFQGMLMGVHCVAVDYVKALTLARASGDKIEFATFLRLIKEKPAEGNSAAQSALSKADISPM